MFTLACTRFVSAFAVSLFLLASSPAHAQVTWSRQPIVGGVADLRVVYDSTQGKVVMVTGDPGGSSVLPPGGVPDSEIWTWDGSDWAPAPALGIGRRESFGLAYDRARGKLVRFGGRLYSSQDTWEWDGARWQQMFSANSPSARAVSTMVYDEARGRVVLFGGSAQAGGGLDDTWEWDGSEWTERFPANRPSPRVSTMVYDAARQRVVLFGGFGAGNWLNDTWEWDGNDWERLAPANSPSPRGGAALAYDRQRQRVVLFGGRYSLVTLSDTWEWDGVDWQQRSPTNSPEPRDGAGAAYDESRGRVVLFGGVDDNRRLVPANTWEWDGVDWSEVPARGPTQRSSAAAAYDDAREEVVLFGGIQREAIDETWVWDGSAWSERSPLVRPPARRSHAMAYDSRRGRVVLFGGDESRQPKRDTWEWGGAGWTQRFPTVNPGAQSGHAMAYDGARDRTVLVCAIASTDVPTWEWDGVNWLPRPGPGPGFRSDAVMAFDAIRERTVLFGGDFSAETWEWDGTSWMQAAPANVPTSVFSMQMVFDRGRGRVVLSGLSLTGKELWEWDGTDWSQRAPTESTPSIFTAMAYHEATERTVALNTHTGGTWEYFTAEPASYTSFGASCAGSAGAPTLAAAPFSRPWVGGDLELELRQAPQGSVAWLLLGSSNTQWLGLALPLDLGWRGMPGCALYTSVEALLPAVSVGGLATWRVPLGAMPSGAVFHAQAIVSDPTANSGGMIMSNAGSAVMGRR